jgi:SAM-dependent methyltransferase
MMERMVAAPESLDLTPVQAGRWAELLSGLATVIGAGPRLVVVDGFDHTGAFADRLATAVREQGRPCTRLTGPSDTTDPSDTTGPAGIAIADGPRWRTRPPGPGWDTVIWLRTPPADREPADREPEDRPWVGAHVVVDLHDPGWPVIRHIDPDLADRKQWYIAETRAFFAVRAATWDRRFGDDAPAYATAVAEIGVPDGAVVLDAGCGTGRALPALRAAAGASGTVIGADLTAEMLAAAREHRRDGSAQLVLADARALPLADSTVDVVFAAGLIGHLPDVDPGLHELARITRPGGRLALFHPSGRAALAARHGRVLAPDEPLAEQPLRSALARTGWRLSRYDDAPHRFLALAIRTTT